MGMIPLTSDYSKFILHHLLLHEEWMESLSGLVLWLSVKQLEMKMEGLNSHPRKMLSVSDPQHATLLCCTQQALRC